MILVPNEEPLREFNSCHDPDSGRFCSTHGIESAAFKAWFGQSKAVDEHGRPVRAFHGTAAEDFEAFNTDVPRHPNNQNRHWLGNLGSWFAAPSLRQGNYDEENAEFVAANVIPTGDFYDDYVNRARLIPVYLSIQNPKEYWDYDELTEDRVYEDPHGNRRLVDGATLKRRLIDEGYDGVVIRNSMTDGNVDRDDWVAFFPHQIKSAVGNRGTWSKHSPRITEANPCHNPPGPGGGRFCSKGSRGGSPANATGRAHRVQQTAARIGAKLGVKPSRVWVSHTARTFESGGLAFTEAGVYDPSSGTITVNAHVSDDYGAVIAHEMSHHQFWTVKRRAGAGDAKAQRFMTLAGLAISPDVRAVQAQLRKDDGITPYSRAYWKSAKPGDFLAYQTAVDETLGELAALEFGQRDRVGTKAAHTRWKALAKALRAAYPKES